MNNYSAEESLRLIAETIEKNRNAIAKNAGKPLILWGVLVAVTAFVIWGLWAKTGNPIWNLLWFAMTAIGGFGTHYLTRNQEKVPKSEISRILGGVWMWFGIFTTSLYLLLWVVALIRYAMGTAGVVTINLSLIIALTMGLSGTISGVVMRKKSVTASAAVATFLSVLLILLVPDGSPVQILSFAILGVIALVIPGVMFQKESSK